MFFEFQSQCDILLIRVGPNLTLFKPFGETSQNFVFSQFFLSMLFLPQEQIEYYQKIEKLTIFKLSTTNV